MGLKVDETKVARSGASLNTNILNGTKFAKDGLELLLVPLGRDVLDEAVGPGISGLVALVGVVLLNDNGAAVDGLAIELLKSLGGVLFSLELDVAEAEGLVGLVVEGDLAGEDGSIDGELIQEGLVVHVLGEVLDVKVALTRLTEGAVSALPHNTAGLVGDEREVQGLKSLLSYGKGSETARRRGGGAGASSAPTSENWKCGEHTFLESSVVDVSVTEGLLSDLGSRG